MQFFLVLIGLLILFSIDKGLAQKLKYKDIYPIIQAQKYPLAYKKLKQFLSQEPENANTLYQLGRISDYRAADYDVLTQGNLALRYADSCIFYYQKALKAIDEKELRKNGEYYEEFQIKNPTNPEKYTFNLPDIQKKLSERVEFYTQFRANLSNILQLFYASIRNYDEATKIFDNIIRQYPTLKEFYLLAGDSTVLALRRLRLTSDSAIHYLSAYKQAIQKYPIKGYDQNFKVLSIQTYRLDGIVSRVDFLQANIILWNYGEWATEVLKVLEGDIARLREQTHQLNNELTNRLQKIESENSVSIELANYEPNRKTLLLLEKYDYNSWLYHWLVYQKNKLDFYKALKSTPDSASMLISGNKLLYYHTLNRELKFLEKSYQNLKENSKDEKVSRHIRFIERNYQSKADYLKLLDQENDWVNAHIATAKNQLTQGIVEQYEKANNSEKYLDYQKDKIATFEQSIEYLSLNQNRFVTLAARQDLEGNRYFAGSYLSKDTIWTGFVARFNAKDKLDWFKSADTKVEGLEKTASLINCLELTDRGCIFMETFFEPQSHVIQLNRLSELDNKGKPWQHVDLNNLLELPRQLHYNFDSGEITLLAKGKNAFDHDQTTEEVNLFRLNTLGEILTQTYFELLGKPVGFIKIADGVMLIGNFIHIKAVGKKDIMSKAGRTAQATNLFVIKIDEEGKIKNLKVIESEKPFSVALVVRIAEQGIYLICQKNAPQMKPYNLKENPLLIEITPEGEFVK